MVLRDADPRTMPGIARGRTHEEIQVYQELGSSREAFFR